MDRRKYKIISYKRAYRKLDYFRKRQPKLFGHWYMIVKTTRAA
jgi:hypothetical protein